MENQYTFFRSVTATQPSHSLTVLQIPPFSPISPSTTPSMPNVFSYSIFPALIIICPQAYCDSLKSLKRYIFFADLYCYYSVVSTSFCSNRYKRNLSSSPNTELSTPQGYYKTSFSESNMCPTGVSAYP